MAQKRVADYFNKLYDAESRKIPQYIGVSNTTNIVDVTFRVSEVVPQLAKGIGMTLKPLESSGVIDKDFIKNSLTDKKIKKAVVDTIAEIKKGGGNYAKPLQLKPWSAKSLQPGVFFLKRARGGVGITFRFISVGKGSGTGANDTRLGAVAREMRNAMYQNWVKSNEDLFNRMPKSGKGSNMRRNITGKTQIAHEMQTTKGALALGLLKENKPLVSLSAFITVTDIAQQIEDNISLNYARNFKKKNKFGKFSFRYFIEASIRKNKAGTEDSDISSIKEKEIQKAVSQVFDRVHGKSYAFLLKLSGSIPPEQQIVDGTISDIMFPLTKSGRPDLRFTVNKKAKAFKKTQDSFKGKQAKGYKAKTSAVTIAVAGVVKIRPQKEKREDVTDLLKLERLINKRLPAEVRRNMGRPALINQTGRFSNSVKVQNFRKTAAGVSAEYTYMTRPYETFENTGSKKWPAGYNPKPLIAKSIRKLAIQYTEQKFTHLRRTQ